MRQVKLGIFPNDARTRAFMDSLRESVRDVAYITARGRGPRAAPALAAGRGARGFDQDLPTRLAPRVAVYFVPKPHRNAPLP